MKFERLIKLEKPFFQLKIGKLYECLLDGPYGTEMTTIIPLKFDKGSNRQFVMTDARNLLKQNEQFVKEIIKMDFNYIWNDGIRSDYPFDFEAMTVLCATREDGTLLDSMGIVFQDFKETTGF